MAESTANPIIRVHGLVTRFGAQVVHDGLDLEVLPNEIFGIVGGSGAGKSVLLRTILGLQQPQGGTVEIGRYDASAVDPASAIELPFAPYVSGLDYIWTTPLHRWRVGSVEVARDVLFCHDTGNHFSG